MSEKSRQRFPFDPQETLKNIRVISFDVGFTLIFTEPPVGRVYADIAGRFGYCLDGDEVQKRFITTWKTQSTHAQKKKIAAFAGDDSSYRWWKDIFTAAVGNEVKPKDLDEMFHLCFHEYARSIYWRLFPDVLPALTALRARGFRLVILSNWDSRLLQTLKELKLNVYFENIYISSLIGHTKPDPAAFQHVIDDMNIPGPALLHVGDTWGEDIMGALSAGIDAVWLNRSGEKKIPHPQLRIPVISTLAQLISKDRPQ